MLQTGAAKLGDGGGITVQPAQSAFEYGILAQDKMENDQTPDKDEQQQPPTQSILTPSGGMFD